MDSSSLWIAIAGLASTTLTGVAGLFFTHRARAQSYRDLLYAKQVDLAVELLQAAAEIHYLASQVLLADAQPKYHEAWTAFQARAMRISDLTPRVMALLPQGTAGAWMGFHNSMTALLVSSGQKRPTQEDLYVVEGHFGKVLIELRALVGTDALSEQTAALFGTRYRQEAATMSAQHLGETVSRQLPMK